MQSPTERDSTAVRFRNLVFAGFVLTGIVTTILGPILPFLSARWSLRDSQAGFFFTAQFIGSLTGVGAYTILAQRTGLRAMLAAGYLLMTAGVALLGNGSHRVSLLGMFLAGNALGVVITASNLLIASAAARNRAAALSLLNVAWSIGAVACPFLVATAAARIGLGPTLLLVALALALVFVALLGSRVPDRASSTGTSQPLASHAGNGFRFGSLANLGVLFFLYIGTENSLGGWAASFATRMVSGHTQMAQIAPSFFWGALLVGRILAPALLRRLSELGLVLAGLLLVLISTLSLFLATGLTAAIAGIALAGLGCAAIFPILVAWLAALPGSSHSDLRGVPFACGNLGGATLPWLVGAVSTRFGGIKAGFLVVVLAGALLMALAHVFQRRFAPSNV